MDGDSQKRCRREIMMNFKLKGDQVKVPSETLLDFTPRQNVSIQTRQNWSLSIICFARIWNSEARARLFRDLSPTEHSVNGK
jgi:hypothetical protein